MPNENTTQNSGGDSSRGEIYVVQPGDSVPALAYQRGLYWESVWKHSRNRALRDLRVNENVLLEGDAVFLPERQLKEVDVSHEKRHRYSRRGVPSVLRLRLLKPASGPPDFLKKLLEKSGQSSPPGKAPDSSVEPKPWANVACELRMDSVVVRVKSDPKGMVEFPMAPDAASGTLVIDPGGPDETIYELKLGHVRPLTTVRGIKDRLHNIGFACGADNEEKNESFRASLMTFQAQNDLKVTGEIDDPGISLNRPMAVDTRPANASPLKQ
jgi:hypothetical protein